MTKQIPYELIPAADLPKKPSGPFDSVVGVDEATRRPVRFPMPAAGVPRAYEAVSDLPASPEPNTAAYVNNDPDPDNNGLWAFLDGAWVRSADRFTGMEGRLSTAESKVGSLEEFRGDALVGFDRLGRDILDLRDAAPADPSNPVWGVADEDGRMLIGVGEDGKIRGRLDDPFAGNEAPADQSAASIADDDGRELVSWDRDGTMRARFPEDVEPRRYPFDDAHDDLVYGVTDAGGRVLFGFRSNGEMVGHPGGSAAPPAGSFNAFDVDSGNVFVTDAAGRRMVASGDPWPYRSAAPIPGGGFVGSQARPMVGTDRVVAGSLDGLLVPGGSDTLTHVLGFGQSLSIGSRGMPLVSVSNEFPEHLLMYQGLDVRAGMSATSSDRDIPLDPATLVGFEPLVAKEHAPGTSRGQTHLESAGEAIVRAAAERLGVGHRVLMSTHGVGATPYDLLKKGTVPYANLLAAVAKTKQLADDRGWSYWVPFICFQHGEGNAATATYFDMMVELQQDLDADIRGITGQAAPVKFYMGQTSTFQGPATRNSNRAMYRAAKELDTYTIVCPQYTFDYDPDLLHMSGPGYYRLGEYYAKALLHEQYGNGEWTGVRPSAVTWDGARQIDIGFHVPVAPLVLDTALVDDPGNYGFEYEDSSASAAVESVTLLDATTVRITLTNTPTGADKLIKYAMNGYGGVRVAGEGPRGCLRDSDETPSRLGGYLHNWCLHFEEPLE